MSDPADDWTRVAVGTSRGTALGRRWVAARTIHAGGRSEKIEARALGGPADDEGYISANLYLLEAGARLLPCEMPIARVARFLADWRADPPRPHPNSAAESPPS